MGRGVWVLFVRLAILDSCRENVSGTLTATQVTLTLTLITEKLDHLIHTCHLESLRPHPTGARTKASASGVSEPPFTTTRTDVRHRSRSFREFRLL